MPILSQFSVTSVSDLAGKLIRQLGLRRASQLRPQLCVRQTPSHWSSSMMNRVVGGWTNREDDVLPQPVFASTPVSVPDRGLPATKSVYETRDFSSWIRRALVISSLVRDWDQAQDLVLLVRCPATSLGFRLPLMLGGVRRFRKLLTQLAARTRILQYRSVCLEDLQDR